METLTYCHTLTSISDLMQFLYDIDYCLLGQSDNPTSKVYRVWRVALHGKLETGSREVACDTSLNAMHAKDYRYAERAR